MYKFPPELINGDLKVDQTIEELIISEIKSLLSTRLGERPLRLQYGSPELVLQALDLSDILVDLNLALNLQLDWVQPLYTTVVSTPAELSKGLLKLQVSFSGDQVVEVPVVIG